MYYYYTIRAKIAKYFGRSDVDIKNHFFSLQKKRKEVEELKLCLDAIDSSFVSPPQLTRTVTCSPRVSSNDSDDYDSRNQKFLPSFQNQQLPEYLSQVPIINLPPLRFPSYVPDNFRSPGSYIYNNGNHIVSNDINQQQASNNFYLLSQQPTYLVHPINNNNNLLI